MKRRNILVFAGIVGFLIQAFCAAVAQAPVRDQNSGFDRETGISEAGPRSAGAVNLSSVATETTYGPSAFYSTNGGHRAGGFIGGGEADIGNLEICPFTTPSSRLYFRKMIAFFDVDDDTQTTVTVSFGIYDSAGRAVALSGPVRLAPGSSPLREVEISGTLGSSKLYFTAWGRTARNPIIMKSDVPDHPMLGVVTGVVKDGIIPNSFDPSMIASDPYNARPISITLILADGAMAYARPPDDPNTTPTPTPTPTPVPVTVSAPAGGEAFSANGFMTVQWKTDIPAAGTAVNFELLAGGGLVAQLGVGWNPDGEGVKTVYLPLLPSRSDYQVRVVSRWNYRLEAISPLFTITGNLVEVLRPRDGEVWDVGSRQRVWWKLNPYWAGTAVNIELWKGARKAADLGIGWDPDGESVKEFLVPRLADGLDYYIRVASIWNPAIWGRSSRALRIQGGDASGAPSDEDAAVAPTAWSFYD
jgi:hypothetical protein